LVAVFGPKAEPPSPNSFLDILNTGKTLLQMTYQRFEHIVPKENIYVVTAEAYESLVKEQLPHLSDSQILKEPMRRNTAPCITYACDKIYARDKNATIVIAASDHLILEENPVFGGSAKVR
jgi:mannose-1-phosphate guanylyltransferase